MVREDPFELTPRIACNADNSGRINMHRHAYLYSRAARESTANHLCFKVGEPKSRSLIGITSTLPRGSRLLTNSFALPTATIFAPAGVSLSFDTRSTSAAETAAILSRNVSR